MGVALKAGTCKWRCFVFVIVPRMRAKGLLVITHESPYYLKK